MINTLKGVVFNPVVYNADYLYIKVFIQFYVPVN